MKFGGDGKTNYHTRRKRVVRKNKGYLGKTAISGIIPVLSLDVLFPSSVGEDILLGLRELRRRLKQLISDDSSSESYEKPDPDSYAYGDGPNDNHGH